MNAAGAGEGSEKRHLVSAPQKLPIPLTMVAAGSAQAFPWTSLISAKMQLKLANCKL